MDNYEFNESDKIIRLSSFISCVIFMLAHISYLVFFLITNVMILVYINIASASLYAVFLILIKYKFYNTYVILTGIEIPVYMSAGTMILGLSAGFYLCLIALTSLAFFAGYFSQFKNHKVKPVCMSLFDMGLFIFVYFWTKYNTPFVAIDEVPLTILFIFHIFIVFSFSVTFLAILTKYTYKLEVKVKKESETDKLTNIPNRKGLEKYFEKIGEQKSNYLLAIFDIDNFKKFNDKNGHLCGDYVLKEIARLASENSADDFVSRWGGEEFIVVSKITDSLEDTYKKIDKIRQTIADYSFVYDNKKLKSTITIGIAVYGNEEIVDDWITRADEKLYIGKQNGKNQTVN